MASKGKQVREMPVSWLIERVVRNRICLPSFQRDFVWKPEQMAKLLESVVRHYPIGTIMLLDARDNEDLGKLSFVGTQATAFSPHHYVIDGQQRLKTFLDVLSSDGKFRPREPIPYKGGNYKVFYKVNVPLSRVHSFEVDKPSFIVPRKMELHEADDYERQGREGLIPTEFLWSEELSRQWARHALPRHKRTRREQLLRNIREVRGRILDYSCPVEIIRMKLKAVHHANMFRLLNEGGTDLTTFDLLVARLNPFDIDLRELWKRAGRELPSLDEFRIDPIYILKTMLLIRQRESGSPTCTMAQVKRIHRLYRNEINFRKTFESDWHTACRAMDRAISDLKNEFGVGDPKYLPYSPMLIPLAAVKWYIRDYNERFKGRMKDRLRRWYWGSIFRKSYEKSTDTRVGEHFVALRDWLSLRRRSNVPTTINFRMSKAEIAEAVGRVRSTADAVYKAILCMPFVQGAKDIYSHDSLGNGTKLHDHHIFPKAFLTAQVEQNGDSKDGDEILEKMNHPINRMLITGRTNQEIQDKPPHRYLDSADARILRRHFLPPQLASRKVDFLSFFERRKAMVVDFAYHRLLR